MWEKAVYETPNGQYRVYVGLKMGVGDANKLAEYIAKHANHDVDVNALAKSGSRKCNSRKGRLMSITIYSKPNCVFVTKQKQWLKVKLGLRGKNVW